MQSLDLDLIHRLLTTQGLSGLEDAVASLLKDELAPHVDSVEIDPVGNVIGHLNSPQATAQTLMVYAHIDQVGFRVKRIQSDGFVRINKSGGGLAKCALGSIVKIGTFDGRSLVEGIVGIKSDHLTTYQESTKAPTVQDLYIDLGARTAKEVRALGVEVGCPVTYGSPPLMLPAGQRIAAASLDDRLGCAILIQLARHFSKVRDELGTNLLFVGVTREETTCKGVRFPTRRFSPTAALGIDCTVCYDTPDTPRLADVSLGDGPVIPDFISSAGLQSWVANPKIRRKLIGLAREKGIAHQLDSLAYTIMFDAQVLAEEGVPSGILYIPNRNTHSAVEVADLEDVRGCLELAQAFIAAMPFDISRGL